MPATAATALASRRRFLRIVGAAGITAVAAPLAACDPVPDAATEPWRRAGAYDDPRLAALSWALLAPNPHNMQPWIADLSAPGTIVLRCDRTRLLPETDPYQRQILIGHGCFLELLRMAAAAAGHDARIEVFPEGPFPAAGVVDDRPVARIVFAPASAGSTSEPLFAATPERCSTKEPFDTERPVPGALLAGLRDAARRDGVEVATSRDAALVAELRDVTWRGHEIEALTPRTLMESVNLMRIGADDIARHRDGIDLGGTMIELGRLLGMVNRETLADPHSDAFRQGMDKYRSIMTSAMAYAWIVTPAGDRFAEIAAGRAYLRLDLAATAAGLAIHPVSQVLQEYPEMADLQQAFNARLGIPAGRRVQMLARLGYAAQAPRSPRRDLMDLIRNA